MWVFDGEQWIDDEEGDGGARADKTLPIIPVDVFVPELQLQLVPARPRPAPPPPPM